MKNSQIAQSLNAMMAEEIQTKKGAIACILDGYTQLGLIHDKFTLICDLWELTIGDLSQILGDLISDMASKLGLNV